MTDLNDKQVVITGGGRGTGAAIATEMNRLGARVTLRGRTEDVLRCNEYARV